MWLHESLQLLVEVCSMAVEEIAVGNVLCSAVSYQTTVKYSRIV